MKGKKIAGGNNGFISMLGLLLALVIICILAYMLTNTYLRAPAAVKGIINPAAKKDAEEDTYQSIYDSTREQIKAVDIQRAKQVEDLNKQGLSDPRD